MIRYLAGLLACCLGLFGGGWLIVVVVLVRGTPTSASLASLGTGAGVALVSAIGIACWSVAWRQRMRQDGVLATRPRRAAGTPGARVHRSRRARRSDRRARRSDRRALRRDRRHAARAARSAPRAAASAGCPQDHDRHPVIPGPRVPLGTEAGSASGEPGEPERPAVVLTELRSLLEPLLTTGPMPVAQGEPDDATSWDLLGEEESW